MSSLLLLLALQDAVVIERDADLKVWNTLGEEKKIKTKQILTFTSDALRIEDVTFGTVIVIKGDRIAKFDPHLKIAYEADLATLRKAQDAELDEIAQSRSQVKGTEDEKLLTATLLRFGRYDDAPTVDAKPTTRRQDVAGRATIEYNVNVETGGRTQRFAEMWFDGAAPANYYAVLAKAGAFHPKIAAALGDVKGAALSGRERFVLLGESYLVDFTATAVFIKSVDASAFDAPAGFAKAPKPDLKP